MVARHAGRVLSLVVLARISYQVSDDLADDLQDHEPELQGVIDTYMKNWEVRNSFYRRASVLISCDRGPKMRAIFTFSSMPYPRYTPFGVHPPCRFIVFPAKQIVPIVITVWEPYFLIVITEIL